MADQKEKIIVCLNGGGPWGFRLQGGAGTGLPLLVSKVRRKSKAYQRLYEGDLILSVNDHACQNLTYDQVMEIADKSGTDLTLEVIRKESNKENQAPVYPQPITSTERTSSPLKTMENGAFTKEIISMSETSSKTTEEHEGLRIQSATLLPMSDAEEARAGVQAVVDSFPPFSELLAAAEASSVGTADTGPFRKTAAESKHEMIKGDTETSFAKKEQQASVSSDSITVDAMDLNELIAATQKKLESLSNGFKSPPPTSEEVRLFEVKKTETTTSVTESRTSETFGTLGPFGSALDSTLKESVGVDTKKSDTTKEVPPPIPPKPKIGSRSDPLVSQFQDVLKEMERDLATLNGGLGFTSDESSFVSTESPFGTTTITKKKKMFSSSSFYEEPGSLYPTMEEQVEMARKVADSLANDNNRKSKGSNMFLKRVKRSSKWIHEGPDPSDESASGTPEIQGMEPPTPDPSQVPFRPSMGHPTLKLVLDPRHPLDANALRSSGVVINEHNAISPAVCHGLVKDLHSPVGKGAALFAKRKKKSEDWVVDEEKVKALIREQERRVIPPAQPTSYNQYSTFSRQDVKLVKTPWEAAMENPLGLCDAAFARVRPDQLADTVIRAADTKRRNSITPLGGCMSPPLPPITPAAAHYDIYHAKAPKGWQRAAVDYTPSYQAPPPSAPVPPIQEDSSNFQNAYQEPRKMVFQNFNTIPRAWKGASAR